MSYPKEKNIHDNDLANSLDWFLRTLSRMSKILRKRDGEIDGLQIQMCARRYNSRKT